MSVLHVFMTQLILFFGSMLLQETTQVAENENVEKNVLLSMYVRPETVSKSKNIFFCYKLKFFSNFMLNLSINQLYKLKIQYVNSE